MFLQTNSSTTGFQNVDEGFAARTFNTGGPNGFFVNSITGTLGATLNGDIYAQRMNPGAGSSLFTHIRSITCWYRVITGFTVPVTFRQLRIRRFTGAVASGGTSIPTAGQKDALGAASQANTASGGDVRIATTGALVSPGAPDTLEVGERITLTKFGVQNDETKWSWNFDPTTGRNPLILGAGHSFAIGTTAAWDAGGTWEFGLHVEYFEGRKQG